MRALLVALTAALSTTALADCPTREYWPTKDWNVSLVQGKTAQLAALDDYAFKLVGKDEERRGYRTDGLVVIKRGVIVHERYARGYDASKRHLSWSVAKSISSALIGAAVHAKALSIDDSICNYLGGYSGTVCDIKVKHVLTFSSGLHWQEGYEHDSYQASSVITMLFGSARHDMVRHVLSHHKFAEPGARFTYSTGEAHVLSAIAKQAFVHKRLGNDAFWTHFFDRIGMSRTTFEEDELGNPQGGSFVYATPRDYAKLGYLYLNDGCWAGERVLPQGWVEASTTINDAFKQDHGECDGPNTTGEYRRPCSDTPNGYMWWLNQPPAEGKPLPFPDAPTDLYFADGHWGQFVLVIPSKDLVIVRTGDDRNEGIDLNELVRLTLEVTE